MLSNGHRLTRTTALALNTNSLENLDSLPTTFRHTEVHLQGISCLKGDYVILQHLGFQRLNDRHISILRTITHWWRSILSRYSSQGTAQNDEDNASQPGLQPTGSSFLQSCLLYTSDAADDLLCVDLGGRRI